MSDEFLFMAMAATLGVVGTIQIYRTERAARRFEAGLPRLEARITDEMGRTCVWENPQRYRHLRELREKIRHYDGNSDKLYQIMAETKEFV